MSRMRPIAIALTMTLVGLAACNDSTSPQMLSLGSAFNTAPAGFNEVSSSVAGGDASAGLPWQPERGRGGPMGGPGMGGFMGGNMDVNFLGGVAAGRGPDRGPFATGDAGNCTFSAATGDVTCAPVIRGGLTITRILTFKTANGTAQATHDSTTNSVRTRMTANGTVQRRDSVTATVQNSSDRTVTGLAVGSTLRTVNGTAQGSESATGKTRDGKAFSAQRTMGDTTTGLTIPVENGRPTYPTAGTVIRSMKVVMTVDGTTHTSLRREVITYNGTATASLVITHDGTTKTCALPLPMGRPTCQ
ncbi:MAG: hypothetical protein IPP90_02365 [Gemmatimonadaceae bacterium]|nr:hypothetical protein [Gemmatimonadaceae bacterium]